MLRSRHHAEAAVDRMETAAVPDQKYLVMASFLPLKSLAAADSRQRRLQLLAYFGSLRPRALVNEWTRRLGGSRRG